MESTELSAAAPAAHPAPPWWEVRAERFARARAALRDKPVLTVLQPFGPMDNDIPGLDVQFADHNWFAANPAGEADIYFNQGYQHNIGPLWEVIRSGRAAVSACWFWDNHHLFASTMHAAMLADISFCAHSFASHYVPNELGEYGGFIPLSPIFWQDSLVRRLHAQSAGRPRDDRLYGGYNSYQEFPDRDRFLEAVIAEVPASRIRIYPHGISPHPYYVLSQEEKLTEWLSFKVSLCASFGINTTIRMFEALLAGQIPIVVGRIHDLDMLFSREDRAALPMYVVEEYDAERVKACYAEALLRFDAEGQAGVARRMQYVLDRHSLRCRIQEMVRRIRG